MSEDPKLDTSEFIQFCKNLGINYNRWTSSIHGDKVKCRRCGVNVKIRKHKEHEKKCWDKK